MDTKAQLKSFKELIVWQRAIQLVKLVYLVTEALPKTEQYALSNQLRRAALSIPVNIAEGYKCKGVKEYLRFLSMAEGSAAELETQLVLLKDLYVGTNTKLVEQTLAEVQKMLYAIIQKLTPRS